MFFQGLHGSRADAHRVEVCLTDRFVVKPAHQGLASCVGQPLAKGCDWLSYPVDATGLVGDTATESGGIDLDPIDCFTEADLRDTCVVGINLELVEPAP